MNNFIPKHNEELEKNILSLFLQNNKLFKIHASKLSENDFYLPKHQLIFKAIKELTDKDYDVDIVLLANLFENKGKLDFVDGRTYLTNIVSATFSEVQLSAYIKELKILSKSRKELNLTVKLNQAIQQNDEQSVIRLKEELLNIEKEYFDIQPKEITEYLEDFEKDYYNPVEGIETPFPSLNRSTCGFKKGELVSLVGLSGSGKSLLALQFALAAVKKNFKTIYFSLEMSPNQMIPRFLSMVLGLQINQIKFKDVDYEKQIKEKIVTLKEYPIKFIFEMVDTAQIYSLSYLERVRGGIDFIIVDYFSLLQDKGFRSEIEQEKNVINRLKNIAKKLNCVVLVLNALSKEVAKRRDGRVTAEDTIGSIHQTYTVDIALSLNRGRNSSEGKFAITKNRSGDYCNFNIFFDNRFLTFSEITEQYCEEPIKDKFETINF